MNPKKQTNTNKHTAALDRLWCCMMLDRAHEAVQRVEELALEHITTAAWLGRRQARGEASQASLAMSQHICESHGEQLRGLFAPRRPDFGAAIYFLHELAMTASHPHDSYCGERLSERASRQAQLVAMFLGQSDDWPGAKEAEIAAQEALLEALLEAS